jgi:hypothetical protein
MVGIELEYTIPEVRHLGLNHLFTQRRAEIIR